MSDRFYPAHFSGLFIELLLLRDDVKRELLDFRQQLGLHFADTDAVLGYFFCGWNSREMLLRLDLLFDLRQRLQVVVVGKYIVRPPCIDDHFLGADRTVNRKFLRGSCCSNSDISP